MTQGQRVRSLREKDSRQELRSVREKHQRANAEEKHESRCHVRTANCNILAVRRSDRVCWSWNWLRLCGGCGGGSGGCSRCSRGCRRVWLGASLEPRQARPILPADINVPDQPPEGCHCRLSASSSNLVVVGEERRLP